MYFLNFSINNFTLLAIIIAIGLVVDDAIVMLENIFRKYEENKNNITNTINDITKYSIIASKEITFAIIAMTITLSAVFIPVGFIDGFIGKLLIEFAWTLAFCVLFSGFIALTLTPMMTNQLLLIEYQSQYHNIPIFLQKIQLLIKNLAPFRNLKP